MIKWESILVGLFADKYDMVSAAMDITKERQEKVTFSDGWLESGGTLVVGKESSIKTIADIKGKKVGCLVASTWEEIAKGLGAAKSNFTRPNQMDCRILSMEILTEWSQTLWPPHMLFKNRVYPFVC